MQTPFEKFLTLAKNNMDGRVNVIPTGIPKYDKYLYGTRQACYYLYGAESGVGKTKFVRDRHIHPCYEKYKEINDPSRLDIAILDFSLEISEEENAANSVSRKLYLDDGIVVPPNILMSLGDTRLSPDIYRKIEGYASYYNDFYRKVTVFDDDLTPTVYHDILFEFFKRHGRFAVEGTSIGKSSGYVPHNPNLYVIGVVDTINLGEEEANQVTKQTIDRISRSSVHFRNKCGYTPIIIQQFNAEISATDRSRYGIKTPLLRDFEDSKRTTKDANIVCGLFDPMRHMKPEDTEFYGYDIPILKSWFRSMHVLKHRNGETNKFIPLNFKGGTGVFKQLPEAKDMGEREYSEATRY